MNGILTRRRVLLFTSTFAILILVLLASGLSDLRLAPAKPMVLGNGAEIRPIQDTLAEIAKQFNEVPFWQQALLVGTFFFVILLSFVFLPSEFRKKLLKLVFKLGLFAFAILYFFENFEFDAERMMPEESIASINMLGEEGEIISAPPEAFLPPEVAPLWSYVITLFVVAVLGALIWWVWRNFANSQEIEERSLKEFSMIAKKSLDNLADGAEWEDVIVRSYVQMGEVVNARRGIRRDIEMTPNEFSERLIKAGLPASPVLRLTRLFERVRYSRHSAGEEEVNEAVACLNEIASVFGEKL